MTQKDREKLRKKFGEFCEEDDTGLHFISSKGQKIITNFWFDQIDKIMEEKIEEIKNHNFIHCTIHSPNNGGKNCDVCNISNLLKEAVLQILKEGNE